VIEATKSEPRDEPRRGESGSDVYLLAAEGLQMREDFGADHMHHKFAVMDDRKVITGSFNWTKGSSNNYEGLLGVEWVNFGWRCEFQALLAGEKWILPFAEIGYG